MPASDLMGQDAQGRPVQRRTPDGYIVFEVLQHVPATQKTLEDAKGDLAHDILYAKMIAKLRTDNGVEVYEDKLPDPSYIGEEL
jgi:parvulin-like peptidyl-prolyl isomerase